MSSSRRKARSKAKANKKRSTRVRLATIPLRKAYEDSTMIRKSQTIWNQSLTKKLITSLTKRLELITTKRVILAKHAKTNKKS